jgi:hypothetical protein
MEKRPRNSTQTQSIGLEGMRESAATLDGIMTGVYGALADRDDIAPEILQLLALGAARAEVLAENLAAFPRARMI